MNAVSLYLSLNYNAPHAFGTKIHLFVGYSGVARKDRIRKRNNHTLNTKKKREEKKTDVTVPEVPRKKHNHTLNIKKEI